VTRTVTRLVRELNLVRKAFRNWPVVAFAGALWRYLPLPPRDIVIASRNGARLISPLDRKAGALYPALDIFAFSAYDCDWRLEEAPFVIDVGAHIGAFALWLAERYPGLRGACYEPDPAAFSYLERNVRGLDVVPRRQAVTSRTGTAPLFRPSPGGGTSSLRAGSSSHPDAVPVPIVSFDELMDEIEEPVALVKLDCEGSEYDIVVESDPSSWRSVRRVVVEYHPVVEFEPRTLVDRLSALGFLLVQERRRFVEQGTYWFSRRSSACS
jgi:FkbM family methyltransferase